MFSQIKGQDKAIEILKRAIRHDKIANSYLFFGPEGVGKFTTALYFGMALNCHATLDKRPCGECVSCKKFLSFSHPDLIFVFPFPKESNKPDVSIEGEIKVEKILSEYKDYIDNKKSSPWKEFFFYKNVGIRIASIRMLEHRIQLSPNEGIYKICIIENAEEMTLAAANAFLKTLEEPPSDTVIILTTSKVNSLLPTIISRCQQIPFYPVSRSIIEKKLEENKFLENIEAKMYARIANGNMEKALRLVEEGRIESREQTVELLRIMINQDDIKFLDFVGRHRTSKTKNQLIEIISHLIIWICDVSYFKNYPSEIINLDKTDILETLYRKNPNVEDYVSELTNFLEEMLRKLDGHVNQQLILTEIYNRLLKTFFPE
ncbi:MAG: DNA polymerase III subunit delta' [Candidatus Cloacimonetes bacterium]|nr:DNA polymerase III subunit delta' [Candidatus Cloacimonadota bacterium]